jgi:hypothetical protein
MACTRAHKHVLNRQIIAEVRIVLRNGIRANNKIAFDSLFVCYYVADDNEEGQR